MSTSTKTVPEAVNETKSEHAPSTNKDKRYSGVVFEEIDDEKWKKSKYNRNDPRYVGDHIRDLEKYSRGKKKQKSPETIRSSSLSTAFEYILSPVKYIASAFTHSAPEPEASKKKVSPKVHVKRKVETSPTRIYPPRNRVVYPENKIETSPPSVQPPLENVKTPSNSPPLKVSSSSHLETTTSEISPKPPRVYRTMAHTEYVKSKTSPQKITNNKNAPESPKKPPSPAIKKSPQVTPSPSQVSPVETTRHAQSLLPSRPSHSFRITRSNQMSYRVTSDNPQSRSVSDIHNMLHLDSTPTITSWSNNSNKCDFSPELLSADEEKSFPNILLARFPTYGIHECSNIISDDQYYMATVSNIPSPHPSFEQFRLRPEESSQTCNVGTASTEPVINENTSNEREIMYSTYKPTLYSYADPEDSISSISKSFIRSKNSESEIEKLVDEPSLLITPQYRGFFIPRTELDKSLKTDSDKYSKTDSDASSKANAAGIKSIKSLESRLQSSDRHSSLDKVIIVPAPSPITQTKQPSPTASPQTSPQMHRRTTAKKAFLTSNKSDAVQQKAKNNKSLTAQPISKSKSKNGNTSKEQPIPPDNLRRTISQMNSLATLSPQSLSRMQQGSFGYEESAYRKVNKMKKDNKPSTSPTNPVQNSSTASLATAAPTEAATKAAVAATIAAAAVAATTKTEAETATKTTAVKTTKADISPATTKAEAEAATKTVVPTAINTGGPTATKESSHTNDRSPSAASDPSAQDQESWFLLALRSFSPSRNDPSNEVPEMQTPSPKQVTSTSESTVSNNVAPTSTDKKKSKNTTSTASNKHAPQIPKDKKNKTQVESALSKQTPVIVAEEQRSKDAAINKEVAMMPTEDKRSASDENEEDTETDLEKTYEYPTSFYPSATFLGEFP